MASTASQALTCEAREGRNATADRTIDVLLLFDERRPLLTAAEVARELGIGRSTTYRYLQTLRSSGLVEEDPAGGGFRLGCRIFQLARAARRGMGGLSELALPFMRTVADETGEAVLLTRRAGAQVVCVERVDGDSHHPVRLTYDRGHVMPLHAGASAKVLLAFSAQRDVEEILSGPLTLAPLTPHTTTDLTELRAQIERVRADGYMVSEGEVEQGVRGIAAPILDARGCAAASLAVIAPAFRLGDAIVPRVLLSVRTAAAAIGQRLRSLDG